MIEKIYTYSTKEEKTIEQVVQDDVAQINHMILPKDAALPEHYSNSNVYMIVMRGSLSLRLDDQETHIYKYGQIINIPFNTRMNVSNRDDKILEFMVVKAPHPKNFKK
ncbi:MAG: cupin domain-containing protein [Dehalococcoidales bacterium]|nr:cupin domain-containing protein [Dehalococcoidales bacterium]MDD3265532.1 cupin domain-containing protein [Dehalococcoidales bacterium]MDD4322614.1 cupin domain-containing protein [Dehalococcoidales bacterium]MDD4794516.1 cupin domain-containing protein [Dehalococcoidales bacterium]MDD5498863.1 cupin domain-containing protein [Dehalococcoidales bacterium]